MLRRDQLLFRTGRDLYNWISIFTCFKYNSLWITYFLDFWCFCKLFHWDDPIHWLETVWNSDAQKKTFHSLQNNVRPIWNPTETVLASHYFNIPTPLVWFPAPNNHHQLLKIFILFQNNNPVELSLKWNKIITKPWRRQILDYWSLHPRSQMLNKSLILVDTARMVLFCFC